MNVKKAKVIVEKLRRLVRLEDWCQVNYFLESFSTVPRLFGKREIDGWERVQQVWERVQ